MNLMKVFILVLSTITFNYGVHLDKHVKMNRPSDLAQLKSVQNFVGRKTEFHKIPIHFANFTSEAFMYVEKRSMRGVKLIQEDMEFTPVCKKRYRDDTQGCVWCSRSPKCPFGWSYHTWHWCGFGGCQNECFQHYACSTQAPTRSPTRAPSRHPTNYPTVSPTPFPTPPTPAPTFKPTPAPTFAHFSFPKCEVPLAKPFDKVYIANELNGMVIEYNDESEGLILDWIHSGQDIITKEEMEHHPQLWTFKHDGNPIHQYHAIDKSIYMNQHGQLLLGNPKNPGYFQYDPFSRTLKISQSDDNLHGNITKILCIGKNDKLDICEENSESATIHWKFLTREEAFPQDFNAIGEYYIVSKDTDLVLEQRTHVTGYPLLTWIPDASIGQLWHSDSYGRILTRLGEFMEAVDVLVFKYKIADVPPGQYFQVKNGNQVKQILQTPETYRFVGQIAYTSVPSHHVDPQGQLSTSSIKEDDEGQQWSLQQGKLVNGYENQQLWVNPLLPKKWSNLPLTFLGQECELKPKSDNSFYFVPVSLSRSWIEIISLKHSGAPYALEEAIYYRKAAAFHLNTILGMSPEELIARAHFFHQIIFEAVTQWKKAGRKELQTSIVSGSLGAASAISNLIGYATIGPTFGVGSAFIFLGSVLSLSQISVKKIAKMHKEQTLQAERDALEILEEIEKSVLSAAQTLASFVEEYNGAMMRLQEWYDTPEGQKQLQLIETDRQKLASELGYDIADPTLFRKIFSGTNEVVGVLNEIYTKTNFYNQLSTILFAPTPLSTSATMLTDFLGSGFEPGSFGTAGTQLLNVIFLIYETFNIYQAATQLKKDAWGDDVLKEVHDLKDAVANMYETISKANGDREDLKKCDDALQETNMLFENDRWRMLEIEGDGALESQIYSHVYDIKWYPGCDHLPC